MKDKERIFTFKLKELENGIVVDFVTNNNMTSRFFPDLDKTADECTKWLFCGIMDLEESDK